MTGKAALLAGACLLFATLAAGQGGPPLRTDDPGTPGNENWEINVGFTSELRTTERRFEIPILDINYGLGDRIQLKYEVPWLLVGADNSPTRAGLGNSLAGVKWRFVDSEKHRFWVSTYPQLEFNNPNHSERRGLTDPDVAFLLPVELSKQMGPVALNLEVGHWFSRDNPQWIAGLAVGRQVTPRFELLGEVYRVSARTRQEQETSFDAGGRLRLWKPLLLIFMAGRSFHGAASDQPHFLAYVGMQFLLIDAWEAEDSRGQTKRP
jgi:hypothetical protein